MPVWLKLIRAPGRRRTAQGNEKVVDAYYRIQELTNAKITSKICRDIAEKLKGRKFHAEWRPIEGRYEGRRKPNIYHVMQGSWTEFKLVEKQRISHEMACEIAARQFGLSFSYVKRIFREIEAASR